MQLAISDIQQSKLSKKEAAVYYAEPKTILFSILARLAGIN